MMRAELLAAGVAESAIEIVPLEEEAVQHALVTAHPDDLVVLFADALTRTWKQVVHFTPERGSAGNQPAAEEAPSPAVLPDVPQPELDGESTWVRDERGVILAPEVSD